MSLKTFDTKGLDARSGGAFEVYRIDSVPSQTNAYVVGRTETWSLKLDRIFSCGTEAMDYVRVQNRVHSELPRLLIGLDSEAKDDLVNRFCFSDEYLHLCRYILGRPDVKKIKKALEGQGINVNDANAD